MPGCDAIGLVIAGIGLSLEFPFFAVEGVKLEFMGS
jgi:hypothetical protein